MFIGKRKNKKVFFFNYICLGSIIFVSKKTNTTTQGWRVTDLYARVDLMLVNQTYQLTLLSPVDLDVADVRECYITRFIELKINMGWGVGKISRPGAGSSSFEL